MGIRNASDFVVWLKMHYNCSLRTYTKWPECVNALISCTSVQQNAALNFILYYLEPNFLTLYVLLFVLINQYVTLHTKSNHTLKKVNDKVLLFIVSWVSELSSKHYLLWWLLSTIWYNIVTRFFQYGANFCVIFQFIPGSMWIQSIIKWIFLL